MYSLTRHSRRVALLRPVSSSILYGPVATIRSVTKDIQEDNLLETHAHNAALRADVKKLGKMLGDAISKHSGEGVFLKVMHAPMAPVRRRFWSDPLSYSCWRLWRRLLR